MSTLALALSLGACTLTPSRDTAQAYDTARNAPADATLRAALDAAQRPAPRDTDPGEALENAHALDLFELLRAAEELNPELAAAREELGAAGGRTLQAGVYPNPTLRFEAEEIPDDQLSLNGSKHVLGFRQPLILGDRRRAAVDAADAEEHVQLLRLEAVRRAVFADVRAAHAEALALRAAATAHDELLAIATRTFEIARTRVDARAVPETEVLRAELEVHELQLGARTLAADAEALVARLRALLGGATLRLEQLTEAPGAGPDAPFLDPTLARDALDGNPELLAAQAAVDAADRRLDAVQARNTPDVSLGLAYGYDREDRGIYEVGLNFALPVFDRNQGAEREARHHAARARREAEAVRGRLEAELAAALAAQSVARDRVDTFRGRMLPATERALEQVRASYAAGRTELLDLLDAQRSHARARLSLIAGLREAGAAEARLWRLVDVDTIASSDTTPTFGSLP